MTQPATDLPPLVDDEVTLPGGPRLALRRAAGAGRPMLLVHGLASNARLWDGVSRRLAAAGHEVVAVDQRGHGRSEQTADGYDTETAAADLAALLDVLGFTGRRAPVVAGQSWGGNVVLTLAARHGGVPAVALVDGGWIAPGERFASFDAAWAVLEPPRFDGVTARDLAARARGWHPDWPEEARAGALANFREQPDGTVAARLGREHHRSILRSLYDADPAALYPLVTVPVLLLPAVGAGDDEADPAKRAAVERAAAALPDATVRWYVGADHDLHAQHPDRCAADLLALARRAEA